MDDYIELGDTGLIPVYNDWFWDNNRQIYLDENGLVRSEQEYEEHIASQKY